MPEPTENKSIPAAGLMLGRARRMVLDRLPARWRLPVRYRSLRALNRLEPELRRLSELAGPGRAIDIGANHGMYSYALARGGHPVEAFEPQPDCAATLRSWARGRVSVHEIGLSDEAGTLTLNIPLVGGVPFTGYATFDPIDEEHETLEVPVRTLDEFSFADVSFMKMDVEGHESRVLHGAEETIRRCRPVMLVEIAALHLSDEAIDSVITQILGYGYEGTFLIDDRWLPLSEFSVERHQKTHLAGDTDAPYVTNVVFRPADA